MKSTLAQYPARAVVKSRALPNGASSYQLLGALLPWPPANSASMALSVKALKPFALRLSKYRMVSACEALTASDHAVSPSRKKEAPLFVSRKRCGACGRRSGNRFLRLGDGDVFGEEDEVTGGIPEPTWQTGSSVPSEADAKPRNSRRVGRLNSLVLAVCAMRLV